jgi:hypothetical protein
MHASLWNTRDECACRRQNDGKAGNTFPQQLKMKIELEGNEEDLEATRLFGLAYASIKTNCDKWNLDEKNLTCRHFTTT